MGAIGSTRNATSTPCGSSAAPAISASPSKPSPSSSPSGRTAAATAPTSSASRSSTSPRWKRKSTSCGRWPTPFAISPPAAPATTGPTAPSSPTSAAAKETKPRRWSRPGGAWERSAAAALLLQLGEGDLGDDGAAGRAPRLEVDAVEVAEETLGLFGKKRLVGAHAGVAGHGGEDVGHGVVEGAAGADGGELPRHVGEDALVVDTHELGGDGLEGEARAAEGLELESELAQRVQVFDEQARVADPRLHDHREEEWLAGGLAALPRLAQTVEGEALVGGVLIEDHQPSLPLTHQVGTGELADVAQRGEKARRLAVAAILFGCGCGRRGRNRRLGHPQRIFGAGPEELRRLPRRRAAAGGLAAPVESGLCRARDEVDLRRGLGLEPTRGAQRLLHRAQSRFVHRAGLGEAHLELLRMDV